MTSPKKRRFELSTSRLDDALIGMSSDPFGGGGPQSVGLRIPPVLPGDTGPLTRPRYLFCLATRVITKEGCKLIGCRQGLTIGLDINAGQAPFAPLELVVTAPNFHFIDGDVSWHLVVERNSKPGNQNSRPMTDAQNWAHDYADDSAMLYHTFTNGIVDPNTGAPILYMRGLTAYTPPSLQGGWAPLDGGGDLKCFYDLKFEWTSSHAWEAFGHQGLCLPTGSRISFYASVLQSDPNSVARQTLIPSPVLPGTPPEAAFIRSYNTAAGPESPARGPIYWRVAGALVFEDEV